MANEPGKGRPTSVTVIGWVWMGIGAYACFAALGNLFVSATLRAHPGFGLDLPAPVLLAMAVFQFGFGALGAIAGSQFLKREGWTRPILELLTWVLIFALAGIGALFTRMVIQGTSINTPPGFQQLSVGAACLLVGVFLLPLFVMAACLRSDAVRDAMIE